MDRLHLFELEDQRWFPKSLRDCLTDLLNHHTTAMSLYDPIVPILANALAATGDQTILDLCSGGGGPLLHLREKLASVHHLDVAIRLSDKFPNRVAADRLIHLGEKGVQYVGTPVDATNVPGELGGFRTLFTSLHHFRPQAVRQMLQDAVDKRRGFGAFEFTERSVKSIIPLAFVPLMALASTPFVHPFRWSRIFFTYFFPIIPLVYGFDGLVSHLRTYSPNELHALTKGLSGDGYQWEIGQVQRTTFEPRITYIVGHPR